MYRVGKALVVVALAALAAAPLSAAGFGIFEQGAKANGMAGAFTAQADDPSALFYGHIGVYAFRREFLLEHYRRPVGLLERMEGLEQLRVLQAGARIRALVWPQAEFGINTPEDLARAQAGSPDPGSARR